MVTFQNIVKCVVPVKILIANLIDKLKDIYYLITIINNDKTNKENCTVYLQFILFCLQEWNVINE